MKTYVTFGQIHVHSVNGKTFDKDCLALIEAPSCAEGRKLAFEIFNGVFHQTICDPSEEQLTRLLSFFPRGIIPVEPPHENNP